MKTKPKENSGISESLAMAIVGLPASSENRQLLRIATGQPEERAGIYSTTSAKAIRALIDAKTALEKKRETAAGKLTQKLEKAVQKLEKVERKVK